MNLSCIFWRLMLHFLHFSFGDWRFVFSIGYGLYESYGMQISDDFRSHFRVWRHRSS